LYFKLGFGALIEREVLRMKLSMFFVATLACALSGCVSTNLLPVKIYKPAVREISEPPLDSVGVAAVGDSMVRQGTYSEYEGIKLNQELDFTLTVLWVSDIVTVFPGTYKKEGQSGSYELFEPSGLSGSGAVSQTEAGTKRVRSENALEFAELNLALSKDGELCLFLFSTPTCKEGVGIEKVKLAVFETNAFQQSLIYSGKIGNKINISYREFSNDVARPAFNNDVEYDLSESTTIAYKGALIEVLEATNQAIRYRVIRNFNVGP
jgi:hypothetical protein